MSTCRDGHSDCEKRTVFDTNKTLWAGFIIKDATKSVVFLEGDYGETYKETGELYGPFDVALIASGAYYPRSLMQGSHCIPDVCVQIGLDLRAEKLVPVHWGTIALGWEDLFEPGQRFLESARKQQVDESNIWVMGIGETRFF